MSDNKNFKSDQAQEWDDWRAEWRAKRQELHQLNKLTSEDVKELEAQGIQVHPFSAFHIGLTRLLDGYRVDYYPVSGKYHDVTGKKRGQARRKGQWLNGAPLKLFPNC